MAVDHVKDVFLRGNVLVPRVEPDPQLARHIIEQGDFLADELCVFILFGADSPPDEDLIFFRKCCLGDFIVAREDNDLDASREIFQRYESHDLVVFCIFDLAVGHEAADDSGLAVPHVRLTCLIVQDEIDGMFCHMCLPETDRIIERVTADVDTDDFLLEGKFHLLRILPDIRHGDGILLPYFLWGEVEEAHLPFEVILLRAYKAVKDPAVDAHELFARIAETVECTGLDEAFDHALVDIG